MPRFFLDIFIDRDVVLDPGGLPFEGPGSAAAAADEMAHALSRRHGRGGWIRVRTTGGDEIHRSVIHPAPEGAP